MMVKKPQTTCWLDHDLCAVCVCEGRKLRTQRGMKQVVPTLPAKDTVHTSEAPSLMLVLLMLLMTADYED